MYKIKFFSSFCDSKNCKEVYERLCETKIFSEKGLYNNIQITLGDDFTHVVIINTAMPEIPSHIPKQNVLGLAFEPLVFLNLTHNFVNYAVNNIGKYFIGDKMNLPDPFVEHYSYMWHATPLKHIPIKLNKMSIMISMKYQTFGHKYRHELVNRILIEKLPIDIYGRGCKAYKVDSLQLKGEFNEIEPYESYDFHIAIENVESNHYFSEKITNPLLNGTIPIYWGCKNIDSYFPNEVIRLTGNVDQDIRLIKDILENPEKYKRNIDLEKIKTEIYLLNNLDTIFNH
tara:strand:+ start:9724 stop:10581 length:858 start_codon:yes stop_codon:yes gene_type:complete